MSTVGPTFGSVIRGARLGYHWSHKFGCFVRIGSEGPPWEIRLAPANGLPGKVSGDHFKVWWESKNPDEFLSLIKPLEDLQGVTRPATFYVDDEGNAVGAEVNTR